MGDERTTQSFKISPAVLTVVITAIISAITGGASTAAYVQQYPQQQVNVQSFVSRDEYDRDRKRTDERLDRMEQKLDALLIRVNQPITRR